MNIIILMTVATIIVAVTEIGKKIVNYLANIITKIMGREEVALSVGLPIAIGLGIVSGIGLEIGMTQSVLEIFGTQYDFTPLFKQVDVGFTCALLSMGSGQIISIVEKNQEDRNKLSELIAEKE